MVVVCLRRILTVLCVCGRLTNQTSARSPQAVEYTDVFNLGIARTFAVEVAIRVSLQWYNELALYLYNYMPYLSKGNQMY